jgi:hypothetical protein
MIPSVLGSPCLIWIKLPLPYCPISLHLMDQVCDPDLVASPELKSVRKSLTYLGFLPLI